MQLRWVEAPLARPAIYLRPALRSGPSRVALVLRKRGTCRAQAECRSQRMAGKLHRVSLSRHVERMHLASERYFATLPPSSRTSISYSADWRSSWPATSRSRSTSSGLQHEARRQVHEVVAVLRVGERLEADVEHVQVELRHARFGLRLGLARQALPRNREQALDPLSSTPPPVTAIHRYLLRLTWAASSRSFFATSAASSPLCTPTTQYACFPNLNLCAGEEIMQLLNVRPYLLSSRAEPAIARSLRRDRARTSSDSDRYRAAAG